MKPQSKVSIPYYKYQRKSFVDSEGRIHTGEFIHKIEYISPKLLGTAHVFDCKVLQDTTSPFRDEFPGIILN